MLKLLIIACLTLFCFAQESNSTQAHDKNATQEAALLKKQRERLASLQGYQEELGKLEQKIQHNIWLKKYENYKTFFEIDQELRHIQKKIKRYRRYKSKQKLLQELKAKEETLKSQLELLKEYKESPFSEVIKPQKVPEPPQIKNPIDIVGALSYIKQLSSSKEYYLQKLKDLKEALDLLEQKYQFVRKIDSLAPSPKTKAQLHTLKKEINDFKEALKVAKESLGLYRRKIEENILKATEEIKIQGQKAALIGGIILGILLFSFFLKWMIRRYIQDNQRAYMANKLVNFNLAFLIIVILLFSYIENVDYLITILGFASAGIAIAMKDMFMSILGWMVIVLGGSIHVGDRVKVKRNGLEYVGDVIDISLLRMTILEDVTLTSYLKNIRSGRVIFIPNNYIFTDLIANYTHLGLKTVWDNVNFNITFDSNYKKAAHIAKETARKYAKGYTDIARKQLNKLRSTYHLKNTNVDVRVYTFAEEYGIRVSLWYMTNSYATLTLRSTISSEIIDRYLQEEDITITYPAQKILLTKEDFSVKREPNEMGEEA